LTITELPSRSGKHRDPQTPLPGDDVLELHAGTLTTPPPAAKVKKKKQRDLYSEEMREDLADKTRQGGLGIAAAVARSKLDNDARRRQQRKEAQERPIEFDIPSLTRTDTGYDGKGGGTIAHVPRPNEFRGTTAQVPGFYPFPIGASAPLTGAPVGIHQVTGAIVGFSAIEWFEAGEITAPSAMVFGLNGFGKSTFGRRQVMYDIATGVRPLIMGDHRPDFTDLMRKMVQRDAYGRVVINPDTGQPYAPQVSAVGFGHPLNPLAVGAFGKLIARLPAAHREMAEREMRARQVSAAIGLLEISAGKRIAPHERTLLTTALRVLYASSNEFTLTHAPIPGDVLDLLRKVPQTLIDATATAADHDSELARARDLLDASGALGRRPGDELSIDRYLLLTENLRQSLDQMVSGQFGEIFNAQTETPIDIDALGVCVDMSNIPDSDHALRAAVLLACWSDGFSAVEASHKLTDAGMQGHRNYNLVCDEFSLVLGVGNGIVQRVDEVTRVQRKQGTGTLFTTHTVKDLQAFDSMEDRQRAMGFLDRARATICFPLPIEEAKLMEGKVNLNAQESSTLAEWATTPRGVDDPVVPEISEERWDAGERAEETGGHSIPPGMGKFLIKNGESDLPGIPVQMHLTPTERALELHNTNSRFKRGRPTTAAQQSPPAAADATGADR
jgi:hypothetical protein